MMNMLSRSLALACVFGAGLALSSSVSAHTVVGVSIGFPPPPVRHVVVQPVRVFVPGHWQWIGVRRVWVAGYWTYPPPVRPLPAPVRPAATVRVGYWSR
jgi:hypothetical protein